MSNRTPSVVASAHGPALTGPKIDRALELYNRLPGTTAPPGADQHALAALLAAHHC